MTLSSYLALGVLGAALCGCVTRTHVENAALTMPWPKPPGPELLAYSPPSKDYPTAGGDILKGASPAEQAAARAAVARPLPAPPKP